MEHTLVFHCIRLGKQVQKALGYKPYPHSLGITQASTIILLSQQRTISQSEIALHLHLEPATVVRLVDELERSGLVERLPIENDRRRYNIALTKKGNRALSGIEEITEKLETFLRTKLTPSEVGSLQNICNKISANLGDLGKPGVYVDATVKETNASKKPPAKGQSLAGKKGGENAVQSPKRPLETTKSKTNEPKRKLSEPSQVPGSL